jgi:mono/diheme cytochrome c family protein
MKGLSVLVLVASISFIAGAGLTYVAKTPWTSDMANQASIKPQEGPMLPPQGSVPTDMSGGPGISTENMSGSQAGHQEMGHQHGASGAAGHQHDNATAKHDHGSKEKTQGMGHQHGTSQAGDHQHGSTDAKHDHGAKNVAPMKPKDSQPLPTDLMGSAGTGPGKTIQSPQGEPRAGDKNAGAHDHGTQKAPQAPAKGAQHNHGSHSHAGGDGHARGDMHSQAQVVNPIRPTEASVKQGQKLFNIYCSVCHGTEGRGGMPMESKIPKIPKFTPELLRSVDDAHMFSMVTSGHGPMPGYAEALTPEERWHVTNYVRTLPGKLDAQKKAPLAQRGSR